MELITLLLTAALAVILTMWIVKAYTNGKSSTIVTAAADNIATDLHISKARKLRDAQDDLAGVKMEELIAFDAQLAKLSSKEK